MHHGATFFKSHFVHECLHQINAAAAASGDGPWRCRVWDVVEEKSSAFVSYGHAHVAELAKAARLAALNGLAVARQHLGSLDRVAQIVRLGVNGATSGDVRDQPKVADGASELLHNVLGKGKNPSRLVYGIASLPLGTPVEMETIFEVY